MYALTQFKLNGMSPFWSPSDSADQCLAQAHALLTCLAGAHDTCEGILPDQADPFDNIRHSISASALEGVATLVALAQYQIDITNTPSTGQKTEWVALRDAYLTAAADLKQHERTPCPPFGQHDAYEATTERLANNQADAFIALMLYPAPDTAALALKVETYSVMTNGDVWDRGYEMLEALAADAKRLAS